MERHGVAKQGGITRRQLLSWMWWGTAGLVVAQTTVALVVSVWPRARAGTTVTFNVGRAGDYSVGEVKYFNPTGGYGFYLSKVADDAFMALYQKCPHLGCPVPWRADEPSLDSIAPTGQFLCPCHQSRYDRYGQIISGPAPRPMDYHPIKVEGGNLVVDTSSLIQRARHLSSQETRG